MVSLVCSFVLTNVVHFDGLRLDLDFTFAIAGSAGDPALVVVVKMAPIAAAADAGDNPKLRAMVLARKLAQLLAIGFKGSNHLFREHSSLLFDFATFSVEPSFVVKITPPALVTVALNDLRDLGGDARID
jgi:hypothetical protein